jgi:hypothetical protein
MKIFLSPQRSDRKIEYKFEKEKITVTTDDMSDTFDFSSMPDGIMYEVETTLDINPIISAKRLEGVLYVELLNFIDENATEEEKFPEWQEV